jgi:hypothetical protein
MLWNPSARFFSATESFTQAIVLRVEGVCRVQKDVASSLYVQSRVKFWLENLGELANCNLGGVTSAATAVKCGSHDHMTYEECTYNRLKILPIVTTHKVGSLRAGDSALQNSIPTATPAHVQCMR